MNALNPEEQIEQARVEARAKVIWGESPNKVIYFLRTKGVSLEEAIQITNDAFAERKAEVRAQAFKQIGIGIVCLCLPVGGYLIYNVFGSLSFLSMVVFGLTCAGGLYGLYCVINGLWALLVPQDEEEDAPED